MRYSPTFPVMLNIGGGLVLILFMIRLSVLVYLAFRKHLQEFLIVKQR